ncbi:unnamed protein product [Ranitomeya imitator]|uniref:MARVEL domain-containing protein n=1 Tax=Ranitomeya imitator TaxID=111125 RepID=A0ABN9KM65_9NEOB|nr:unnamed protein product [Ranitomeya imitator]
MEGASFGAGRAGGGFDPIEFLKQPQTILRILSWTLFPFQVFSVVVFGSIINEGYINIDSPELHCVYNKNEGACNYAISIGIIAFFGCVFFIILDINFPSNQQRQGQEKSGDGGYGILRMFSDFLLCKDERQKYQAFFFKFCTKFMNRMRHCEKFSVKDVNEYGYKKKKSLWSFLWFVCFCFLANQWQRTPNLPEVDQAADAARAAIAFSFFSIISWAAMALKAYQRFRLGTDMSLFATDQFAPGPNAGYQATPQAAALKVQKPIKVLLSPKMQTSAPRDTKHPRTDGDG